MIRKFFCLILLIALAVPQVDGQINAGKVKAPNKTTQTNKTTKKASKPAPSKTNKSQSGAAKSKKTTASVSNSATQRTQPSSPETTQRTQPSGPETHRTTTSYTGAAAKYPFRRVGTCPLTDPLNPMDGGIILGWTTVDEAVAAGGEKRQRDDYENCVGFSARAYWDHEGDGIIKSVFMLDNSGVPASWSRAGLDFTLSYNEIMKWLERSGFEVTVKEKPTNSAGSLSAELVAFNQQNQLKLYFTFNYSKKKSVTDKNTLFSITASRKRIHTSTTDYSPFFPLEGVNPGVTTLSDLRRMGGTIDDEYSTGKMLGYYFWCPGAYYKSNTIYRVHIDGNELPYAWARNGESRIMTYNKWMRYFADNGFIVINNEPRDKPDASYPYLVVAINPELGLRFRITFKKMSLPADGDNPDVCRKYSLEIL